MVSLTIQLDDNVAESLRQMARESNRTESELIREAISSFARQQPCGQPKGIGKYHSGRSDVSEKARTVVRQAVEDRQWP